MINPNTKVVPIDHGWANMKTEQDVFTSGVSEITTEPALFNDVLEYNNKYYKIGGKRLEVKEDKVHDDNYYLLTLAATAMTLERLHIRDAHVLWAVGLPLTRFGEEKDDFIKYLMRDKEVTFKYNKIQYHIVVEKVSVYPQCYAAVSDKLRFFDNKVYIVAFHDTWEKFVGWIDPGALDIFDKGIEEEEDTLIEEEDLNIEISPNEEMLALLERLALANGTGNSDRDSSEIEGMAPQEEFITQRDLYMKLYNVIKVNLVSEEKRRVCPCGWYSVINEEGEDEKLLVFDVQLNSYEDIQRNIKNITPDMSVDALQELYFGTCDVKPELFELQLLLDYIIDTGEMPLYFELSQREAFDLKEIGEAYQKIAATKEDEDSWLKELFEKAPILQQMDWR